MDTTGLEAKDATEKSLPGLLGDLADEMSTLVREEIALAKAELKQKIEDAGRGAGLLFGAAIAVFMGLGSLTALAVVALGLVMEPWLATLIVTVVWLVVAAALGLAGRGKIQHAAPPVPEKTIETLKEDARWAKHPTRYEER